jgi:hypothetical protein
VLRRAGAVSVLIALSLSVVSIDKASASPFGESSDIESLIAADVDFREALGFQSDPDYVRDLYAHPERTTGHRDDGLVMTPSEAKELQIRLALEADAIAVEGELSDRADWAGVAIDNLAGGKVAVMLTSPKGTPQMPSLTYPERLEVRDAEFTLAQLVAEQEFLWRAQADGRQFMAAVTSVSIDVLGNRVLVDVYQAEGEVPPSFRAEGWFGPDAVEVVPTHTQTEPLSLKCDSNAPPVYGGVSWDFRSVDRDTCVDPWCTVGFEMQRDGYAGTDWVLTAGHCATSVGQSLYHWGVSFAWWRLSSSLSYQDFGLMEAKTTAGSISKVFWAGAKRQVSGASTSYTVGQVRCQTGWKTGYSVCGTILSASSSCGVWTGFVKTTADARPGDSGGPVYIKPSGPSYVVRANGIISCGTFPPGATVSDYTWYPKWSNIPSGWGVHISLL